MKVEPLSHFQRYWHQYQNEKWVTKNINVAVAGLIKPAVRPSQVNSEYDNSGEDFTGPIDKKDIIIQLNNFFKQPEVKSSAMQQGKLEWDFSLRC